MRKVPEIRFTAQQAAEFIAEARAKAASKTPRLTEVFSIPALREAGTGAKPPGPRLKKLLDSGVVRLDDTGTYLGTAADGQEVQLGHETQDPAGIERYLAVNPTPDMW